GDRAFAAVPLRGLSAGGPEGLNTAGPELQRTAAPCEASLNVSMRERLAVTPAQYRRVAYAALVALTVIVLTGAAVRLTGSGLGCPDWPKCYGQALPPLSTHALIEFGNRALSGLVGVIAVAAAVLAFTRRPFRRDVAVLALALPLCLLGQAVVVGFSVTQRFARV